MNSFRARICALSLVFVTVGGAGVLTALPAQAAPITVGGITVDPGNLDALLAPGALNGLNDAQIVDLLSAVSTVVGTGGSLTPGQMTDLGTIVTNLLGRLSDQDLSGAVTGLLTDLGDALSPSGVASLLDLDPTQLSGLLGGLNATQLGDVLGALDPATLSSVLGGMDPDVLAGLLDPSALNDLLGSGGLLDLQGLLTDPVTALNVLLNGLTAGNLTDILGEDGGLGNLLDALGAGGVSDLLDNLDLTGLVDDGLLNQLNVPTVTGQVTDLVQGLLTGLDVPTVVDGLGLDDTVTALDVPGIIAALGLTGVIGATGLIGATGATGDPGADGSDGGTGGTGGTGNPGGTGGTGNTGGTGTGTNGTGTNGTGTNGTNGAGGTSTGTTGGTSDATTKTTVILGTPVITKKTQIFGQKKTAKRATISSVVTGATSGTVTFRAGTKKITSVAIKNGTAKVVLPKTLAAGKYTTINAYYAGTSTTAAAKSPNAKFTVTKAHLVKKVKLTGTKSFSAGAKPKLHVKLGKLTNGAFATGTVKFSVNGKKAGSVKITAKNKGKITTKLAKKYASSIKVKITYVGSPKASITKSSSKKLIFKVK